MVIIKSLLISSNFAVILIAFFLLLLGSIFRSFRRKAKTTEAKVKNSVTNGSNPQNSYIPEEVFELVESILGYGSFLKDKDRQKIESLLELRQFYRSFLKTQNLMAHEIIELLNEAAEKLRAFNIIIGTYVTHVSELRKQIEELRYRKVIQESEYQKLESTNKKYEQMIQGLVQTQIIVLAQQASAWLDRYNNVFGRRAG